MTNGKITRAPGGGWIARPGDGPESVITVTANVEGQTREMARMTFRVLRVPDPIARVSGRTAGRIPRADLVGAQGVEALLEGFLFDLRYTVSGFNVSISTPQGDQNLPSTGFAFTQAQRDLMNRVPRGTNVIINNIVARNPQLGERTLNTLVLTID
jgi:hypothetical protein